MSRTLDISQHKVQQEYVRNDCYININYFPGTRKSDDLGFYDALDRIDKLSNNSSSLDEGYHEIQYTQYPRAKTKPRSVISYETSFKDDLSGNGPSQKQMDMSSSVPKIGAVFTLKRSPSIPSQDQMKISPESRTVSHLDHDGRDPNVLPRPTYSYWSRVQSSSAPVFRPPSSQTTTGTTNTLTSSLDNWKSNSCRCLEHVVPKTTTMTSMCGNPRSSVLSIYGFDKNSMRFNSTFKSPDMYSDSKRLGSLNDMEVSPPRLYDSHARRVSPDRYNRDITNHDNSNTYDWHAKEMPELYHHETYTSEPQYETNGRQQQMKSRRVKSVSSGRRTSIDSGVFDGDSQGSSPSLQDLERLRHFDSNFMCEPQEMCDYQPNYRYSPY